MPGCRKFDAPSQPLSPPRRIELRRYVRRGARPPRPANDNRAVGSRRGWYWALAVGVMPTLGLIALLSSRF